MVSQCSDLPDQEQRLHLELGRHSQGSLVRIEVQRRDERLGWYTSGALTIPLCQLPLLEQAIAEMRSRESAAPPESDQIIPFPGLATAVAE